MCVCVTPFITTLLPALHFPLSRNTITTSWQRAAHLLPHYKSPSTDSIFEMQKQSLCAGSRYSNDSGASADAAKIEIWVNIHDSDTEKDTYTDGGSLLTCTSWMHPSLTSSSTHFHCRCLGFPSFPPFLFCPSPLIPPPLSLSLSFSTGTVSSLVYQQKTLQGQRSLAWRQKLCLVRTKKERRSFGETSVPKERERQMLAASLPRDGSEKYLEDCSCDFWLGIGVSAGGEVNWVENGDSLPGLCVNVCLCVCMCLRERFKYL